MSQKAASRRRHGAAVALGCMLMSGGLACRQSADSVVSTHVVARQEFIQKVTVEGHLEATQNTQLTVPVDVPGRVRLAWLEDEGTRVEAQQVVARFDAKAMQRRLEDGRGEHLSTALQIDKTRIESDMEVGRLATAFESADLELQHAREFQKLDSNVFARRDILQDAIDSELSQARKDHAEHATDTQRELTRTELDLLTIRQRQSQLDIDQAQDALANLEIRAPHSGLLQLSRDWRGQPPRVGAEMWRGQSIGQIPDLNTLQARVYVLEADAGGLAEGKSAQVTVEAHPQHRFEATIRSVEALAKPRIPGSPVQYFGVILELKTTDLDVMKVGSRVQATLVLERREDALVVPRQAVFQHQGTPHVYVRSQARFTPRAVQVGSTSLGWAVIESGLEDGEEVALSEPPDAAEDVQTSEEPSGDGDAAQATPNDSTSQGTS